MPAAMSIVLLEECGGCGCRPGPPFSTFRESLDLASGRRECFLDRARRVLVAPIIGGLVADDDVLVGRNRYPNVDAIDGAMPVLRTRRRDGNATPRDVVFECLQASHLVFYCRPNGL